jgi:hypothetical protein
MRTGYDMRCYQPIANAFTGICTRAYGRIDSSCFTTYEDGDIAAADELTPYKAYFGGFCHGIRRLNGRYQSACLNHAQGYTVIFVGHGLFSCLISWVKK